MAGMLLGLAGTGRANPYRQPAVRLVREYDDDRERALALACAFCALGWARDGVPVPDLVPMVWEMQTPVTADNCAALWTAPSGWKRSAAFRAAVAAPQLLAGTRDRLQRSIASGAFAFVLQTGSNDLVDPEDAVWHFAPLVTRRLLRVPPLLQLIENAAAVGDLHVLLHMRFVQALLVAARACVGGVAVHAHVRPVLDSVQAAKLWGASRLGPVRAALRECVRAVSAASVPGDDHADMVATLGRIVESMCRTLDE